ncbi:IclR family transcriptional regulator [Rhodosalinus halophilus]|uniref:IclR family transcriptional regulator n=1 Tax=Rhodosalinus halophilus TaxID=2259333 RepID=A0A365UD99_9RHOB|nr:IclR family transcriptional regulator [Rhodosalinus halophilus]RBI87519.1 IclR family transcriptional regulator [Rhodosalinus halophilus]
MAGVQSLEAALRLLSALAAKGGPAALSELARDCGMQASKAHRYLASFQAAGLVAQAGRSGKYDLGPEALTLGLAALARHDFVNRAADALPDLCAETGMTVLLAVWGTQGATVVRWERAAAPLVTSMGLGTALPLLTSATGRVFLGWAPPAVVAAQRETERARIAEAPDLAADFRPTPEGIAALAETVRAQGYAAVDGRFIPGLVAAAAPILDWQGQAQAAVTLVGTDRTAIAPGAPELAALRRFCAAQSVASECCSAANEKG